MDKLISKKLGVVAGVSAAIIAIPVDESWGALVKIVMIGLIAIAHVFAQAGVDKKRIEKEAK